MRTFMILLLVWVLSAGTIPGEKPNGEIIINNIPAWKPVTVSGKYMVEINVPELASDFIAKNKIKVAVKFMNIEGFKTLPYTDNQSVSPGTYEYSLAPLKLTCTFSPRAAGGANGSSVMPMQQISFNFTSITPEHFKNPK